MKQTHEWEATEKQKAYYERMSRKSGMETCQNCGKKAKLVNWIFEGSVMDFVHGNYQRWCKECCDKEQRTHLLKQLKDQLTKDFGKRCPSFQWSCSICSVWLAWDILHDLYLT